MRRRLAVVLILLLATAFAVTVQAARDRRSHPLPSFVRLGSDAGLDSPQGAASREFLRLLESRGGGRVVVRPFLDGSFGNEETLAPKVQQGIVEAAVLGRPLWRFDPAWQMFDLPFVVRSRGSADRLWAEVGPELTRRLRERGLVLAAVWDGGTVAIDARRPLASAQDWQGLRLFSGLSPAGARAAEGLGATAAWGALDRELESIHSGSVDAFAAPLPEMLQGRYGPISGEVLEGYGYRPVLLLFSALWWDRQPAEVQQLLLTCAQEAAPAARQAALSAEAQARLTWRQAGVTLAGPPPLPALPAAQGQGLQSFERDLSPDLRRSFNEALQKANFRPDPATKALGKPATP
ncbi:MAG: TRAP transporter substrate-binding protein DctP [Firmicutes bacterium]|nr:TRAP transporter substrate-binding protein DctP [Bacillota bacterium]